MIPTRILLLVGIIGSLFLPLSSAQCLECCTCEAGAPGSPGADGATGEKGQRGRRGVQGDTGVAGPTGPTGEDGLTGATGAAGAKGDKGDTGDAGPQGETGATGSPGAKGDSGDPQKKSVFHVYNLDSSTSDLPLSPIIFASTSINTGTNGADYNVTSGIFTCSIAGVYMFNFAFTKPPSSPGLMVELRQGEGSGSAIKIISFTNNDNHDTIANSFITDLSVDEQIWVQPQGANNNFYLTYTKMNSFSGVLLYPA